MSDIQKMQVGQIVDFCISYNERQKDAEERARKEQKPRTREATQADIDAYFGR